MEEEMKKILLVLVAFMLIFALVGCNNGTTSGAAKGTPSYSTGNKPTKPGETPPPPPPIADKTLVIIQTLDDDEDGIEIVLETGTTEPEAFKAGDVISFHGVVKAATANKITPILYVSDGDNKGYLGNQIKLTTTTKDKPYEINYSYTLTAADITAIGALSTISLKIMDATAVTIIFDQISVARKTDDGIVGLDLAAELANYTKLEKDAKDGGFEDVLDADALLSILNKGLAKGGLGVDLTELDTDFGDYKTILALP
jgi:hypothetical protein